MVVPDKLSSDAIPCKVAKSLFQGCLNSLDGLKNESSKVEALPALFEADNVGNVASTDKNSSEILRHLHVSSQT